MVFVDHFCKPLILLDFIDFCLVDRVWFLRVVLWSCGSLVVFGSRVAHCVSETVKAAKKPQKPYDVVFAVFVVFAELVDLRSHVVVKGKPHKDLTTDSILC